MKKQSGDSPIALLRLVTWLSPAFPTGSYSYSGGLEAVYADGLINSQSDLEDWIRNTLLRGSVWNDLVLCAASHRNDEDFNALCAFASALSPGNERYQETIEQGHAFLNAAKPWVANIISETTCPLPIAVGAVARSSQIPVEMLLPIFAHAQTNSLVQAVLRMGYLGQTQGVEIMAALEGDHILAAEAAAQSTIDDLGSATLFADLMTLRHETTEPRIFRS
ncbi:urease accessory protein UreF [Hyphococcus lacteus]|uniref:Urease accessory protein UreF n=1 Tax=Hyphococcus lacteus TaxID=3143536 RepID=A0ABV3Z7M9_9PROT